MRETAIENWLGAELRSLGCLYYKFVSPGNVGVPDRIVITPRGQVVFVELKADTGELSAMQRTQLHRIAGHAADVRLIRGRAQAKTFVEEIRYGLQMP